MGGTRVAAGAARGEAGDEESAFRFFFARGRPPPAPRACRRSFFLLLLFGGRHRAHAWPAPSATHVRPPLPGPEGGRPNGRGATAAWRPPTPCAGGGAEASRLDPLPAARRGAPALPWPILFRRRAYAPPRPARHAGAGCQTWSPPARRVWLAGGSAGPSRGVSRQKPKHEPDPQSTSAVSRPSSSPPLLPSPPPSPCPHQSRIVTNAAARPVWKPGTAPPAHLDGR